MPCPAMGLQGGAFCAHVGTSQRRKTARTRVRLSALSYREFRELCMGFNVIAGAREVFASSEIKTGRALTGATSATSGASKMLVKILHGLAVLFALLSFVLLDRALAQSAPTGATDEVATFASRFSAL